MEPTEMQRPLRLLTLNIAHGRGLLPYQGIQSRVMIERQLGRIADLLKRENADIACLQEVDASSHWNRNIDLLDFLQKEADFPHAYLGVHNRRMGDKPLAYGNGILSRFPFLETQTHPFGERDLGEKGFLYTEVEIAGHRIPLVNLHFDYRSRRRRIDQVNRVIHIIHESLTTHTIAPIICGDFNAVRTRKRDAVEALFGYILSHRRYARYPEIGNTFPAPSPVRCLDFIFVPRPLRVNGCTIIRSMVSDHRPVRIDFQLPETIAGEKRRPNLARET